MVLVDFVFLQYYFGRNMKKIILILALLGFFPGVTNAAFEDWTKQNQRLYMSALTLHAVDVIQTLGMVECQEMNPHCPYIEKNPFLGTHPSKAQVILTVGAWELISYKLLNNKRLTSKQRKRMLIITNTIGLYPIINNEQVGLGFYVPIIPYRQFIK